MKDKKTTSKFASGVSRFCFRVLRRLVLLVYPKITVHGAEILSEGGYVLVGNHCQMHGPIIGELYLPGPCRIWCAGEMMELRQVPAYAYQDFWSAKPKAVRWFFKLASYAIAPVSVCIFNQAHTIPVYHDARVITTFRRTVSALEAGENVVIFPECYEPYNQIVNRFQDRFIDVARMYHKRTGKALRFIPIYVAPRLRGVYLGKPIAFTPGQPMEEERARICKYLMDGVTELATALPEHTVVPYANLSPKQYGTNRPKEDHHAETRC